MSPSLDIENLIKEKVSFYVTIIIRLFASESVDIKFTFVKKGEKVKPQQQGMSTQTCVVSKITFIERNQN